MEGEDSSNEEPVSMEILSEEERQYDPYHGNYNRWFARESVDNSSCSSNDSSLGTIESEESADALCTTEYIQVFYL